MTITGEIAVSWRSFWTLRRHHEGPGWARLLIASALGVLVWVALWLLVVMGVATVEVSDPAFLRQMAVGILLLFQAIAWTTLAFVCLVERLLPEAKLAALSPVRDWRSAALVSMMLVAGVAGGNAIGSILLKLLYPSTELFSSAVLSRQLRFLRFLPFLAIVGVVIWRAQMQRHALQTQAAEAQLRLLHAQIEPHFLFNTLANIESLLDTDPDRARAMLEAFSDYLRAGLNQLRTPETVLGAELDMATSYLRLLQIRMQGRLDFSVDADPQARLALLPPLLLQPLVENAIRHGLEPKIEGGTVRIRADIERGRLRLQVDDDGLGANATSAKHRPGNGMALANVRSRLWHRYRERAQLALTRGDHGTRAEITIPYQAAS